MTKLSKAQQELFDAMGRGVKVHFMGGISSYYFRSDTMRSCSPTAYALLKTGLVEKFDEEWKGHQLRIVAATATAKGE